IRCGGNVFRGTLKLLTISFEFFDLSCSINEEFARGFGRRRAHSFDHGNVSALQLDKNRHLTAKRKMRELNARSRENRRHARIDGIASVLEDSHAGFD